MRQAKNGQNPFHLPHFYTVGREFAKDQFGLANEAFGYILTKVDYKSFPRYEYISRTSLGEMTGEILIEKALELVNRSPATQR